MKEKTAIEQYFDARRALERAGEKRDPFAQLEALKAGLAILPIAIAEFEGEAANDEERGWIPEHWLFVQEGWMSLPVIVGDDAADALLRQRFSEIRPEVDLTEFDDDRLVMEIVREHLATHGATPLKELRRLLSKPQSKRLTALYWLWAQTGEISYDNTDGDKIFYLGRPEQVSTAMPTFRAGKKALATAPLALHTARPPQRPLLVAPLPGRTTPPLSAIAFATTVFPPNEQRRKPTITFLVEGGSWQVRSTTTKADGSETSTVDVRDGSGTLRNTLDIPHALYANAARPGAPLTLVDADLNVHVYDLDGNERAAFSLLANPEFRSVFGDSEGKPLAFQRTIAVSLGQDEFAFSVVDHLWRFKLDGTLISSFQMPAKPTREQESWEGNASVLDALREVGLPTSSTSAQIASYLQTQLEEPLELGSSSSYYLEDETPSTPAIERLERAIGALNRDWIYDLAYVNDDRDLVVAGYSGLTLLIGESGDIKDSWMLPGAASRIVQLDDRLVLLGWQWLCFIEGTHVRLLSVPDAEDDFFAVLSTIAVSTAKGTIKVLDLVGERLSVIPFEGVFKGVYPTADGFIVETGTNSYSVRLSDL